MSIKLRTLTAMAASIITLSALSSPLWAQSSKAVAGFKNLGLSSVSAEGTELMRMSIRTANASDLMINLSAQCNLLTQTKGKTSMDPDGLVKDTATASAGLSFALEVDGEPLQAVIPSNAVAFCQRSQTLSVELGQALANCTVTDGVVGGDACTLENQSVELLLNTLSTHSFNYTIPDVSPGVHTIKVMGILSDDTNVVSGDAMANAYVGMVSATIEEVRFTKDLNVDLTQ